MRTATAVSSQEVSMAKVVRKRARTLRVSWMTDDRGRGRHGERRQARMEKTGGEAVVVNGRDGSNPEVGAG